MTPPTELLRLRAGPAALCGGISAVVHGPWRVLYLGRVEQGMTYAPVGEGGAPARCDPSVIGFEYVRTAAAAAFAFGRLWELPPARAEPHLGAERVLCIGLGAGSLPLWLSHHCPHLSVACVELHGLVAQVAAQQLLNPLPFELAIGDGGSVLAQMAAAQRARAPARGSVRAILLDAYDSAGRVPAHLRGRAFLADCAAVLCPARGVLIANVWHGPAGSAQHAELAAFARAAEAEVGRVYGVRVHGQEANLVLVALRGPRPPLGAAAAEALAPAHALQPALAPEVLTILDRLGAGLGGDSSLLPGAPIISLEQLLLGRTTELDDS